MNSKEYLEQSARTCKDLDQIRRDIYPKNTILAHDIVDLIADSDMADSIKRGLFYKEAYDKLEQRIAGYTQKNKELYDAVEAKQLSEKDFDFDVKDMNLIHAALGMISEAGEILEEVLRSHLEEREIDMVNIKEEVGDNQWYAALALRTAESNFEEVHEKNIAKLALRYKDAFSEWKATEERDLQAERKILEK